MYTPIRDYAIIGNLRSAVLVSKEGSIDWAPAPFIDSPSVFGAILDEKKGGYWSITPKTSYTVHQWYEADTNVLVTQFVTESGTLELTDFIPIEKEKTFTPEEKDTTFRIHRKVMCTEGACTFRVNFVPRFNYARGETTLRVIEGGVYAENKTMRGVLASGQLTFQIAQNRAVSDGFLKEGEVMFLIFRYNIGKVIPVSNERAHHDAELEETKAYWRKWVHTCDLKTCPIAGDWHDLVVRSSLLLKILFFEPFGTIAAAPTTSLPETIGGERNWDYRYTWLRDSSWTLSALFKLGSIQEAEEYARWVVNMCRTLHKSDPQDLQVIYGLRGETNLREETLDHLEGYEKSQPVRIGNGAFMQKQWDVYGGIIDMIWTIHKLREHHVLSEGMWETIRSFANHVVTIWREPDEGLWEIRGERRHFVYSKAMCWVALDRAIKISEVHQMNGERTLWEKEKDAIFNEIMTKGWSEAKQSFTQTLDSDVLDASVLMFPTIGIIRGNDPKMVSTIERIEQELSAGDGLLYRYNAPDGLPGREGAFLLASFWLVDALIYAGKKERAAEIFEKIISLQNHVGLFAEEIDPVSKKFLGNFPQAYTHIGLINSAFNLIKSF